MTSARMESVETRLLLTVKQVFDAGGLPRELTGIGNTLYYALDAKADGELAYTNLHAYQPKTKTRLTILRSDGKRFGKQQFFLSEGAGQLIVAERRSVDSYQLWTVKNGESIAQRLLTENVESIPKQFYAFAGSIYFEASVDGERNIYAFNGETHATAIAFSKKEIGAEQSFTPARWTDRLALATEKSVLLVDGNRRIRTVRLPARANFVKINGTFAVGQKLVIDAQYADTNFLYALDRKTSEISAFSLKDGAAGAKLIVNLGESAIVQARKGSRYPAYVTDFAGSTTRMFSNVEKGLPNYEFHRFNEDVIYYSIDTNFRPTDPEEAKPYNGSDTGSGTSGSYGQAMNMIGQTSVFYFIVPTATRGTTASASYGADAASGFVRAGEYVYHTVANQTGTAAAPQWSQQLYTIAGHSGWDGPISSMFGRPAVVDGRILYSPSATATNIESGYLTLQNEPRGYNSISGSVVSSFRTNEYGSQVRGDSPLSGRRVFIDLNRNGVMDADEVKYSTFTGSGGGYRIANLPAGKYQVRLEEASGWRSNVPSRVIRLARVADETADFRSDLVSAPSSIYVIPMKRSPRTSKLYNFEDVTTVWLDLNANGFSDFGEPQADRQTGAGGNSFSFNSLSPGSYLLGAYNTYDGTKKMTQVELHFAERLELQVVINDP